MYAEMADRLRQLEQQRRDEEIRRQDGGDESERLEVERRRRQEGGDESERLEVERRRQEEMENERIYHDELRR